MINVKDAGATGNGLNDDWYVLQGLLNNNAGTLYFPPGKYRIERTLVFPPWSGYHVIGAGMAQRLNACDGPNQEPGDASYTGSRALLVWGGVNGGTMVECQGTGLVWDGLTLWGRFQSNEQNCPSSNFTRAGIGIRICNSSSLSSSVGRPALTRAGKFWFSSIIIDDCAIGIKAEGSTPTDSCAFGYFWPRDCDTCVQLEGTSATMFTFRYIHPLSCLTVFRVTSGGRIYLESMDVVLRQPATNATVLDVSEGGQNDGFYHLNGVKVDGRMSEFVLLNNVDTGNGSQLFRFTDTQFFAGKLATVTIDRTGGSGQSILDFAGARWMEGPLAQRITIKGASAAQPSRLIIRGSMLDSASVLVNPTTSNAFRSEDRIRNWTLANGVQF